jgi:hypothetical protein
MLLKEAFEIVLCLANDNVIDDPELKDEQDRQNEAIEIVQQFYEANVEKA